MASSTEVLHDLTVDSVIRGYHVYKDIWVPIIGEILFCEQEPGNEEDRRFCSSRSPAVEIFNWKIWLARRTLEQITINSLKGAE